MLFEKISPSVRKEMVFTKEACVYLFRGVSIIGMKFPKAHFILLIIYFIWSVLINLSVTLYLPTSFLLSYITHIKEFTPGQFLTSLQVAINSWGCPVKLIIFVSMQQRLRNAEATMDKLDARCKLSEEHQRIRNVVAFGNKMFLIFTASYWSYSFSTFFTSIYNGRPPYSVYNPVMNWRDSKHEFFLQSVIEFFLMDFTCFQEAIVDSYPVIYISILRTHLQILAERVRKLGLNMDDMTRDERCEELVECILDHKNILELFNMISPVISGTIFVQFLIMGMILGITLINIMLFADISTIVASTLYIISVVLETFPCCYYANCMMDDSDALASSIFHSGWIEQDKRYKKMLMFYMQNTQKTLTLTAMKLFPITMGSNLNVAKFAFSVYTLMKQMNFGENFKI